MPELPLPSSNRGIAVVSLGVSFVALGLKYAAYATSGSIALYADALETIINVVAAAGGLWALSVAELPADTNHPYGHHKAEYLSAVAEGALVVITAFVIGHEAVEGWLHPNPPKAPWLGLGLNALATVVNLAWGLIMLRVGQKRRSPALVAGGQHVLSDVWTGVALVVGVTLIPLTGWVRLDAILAGLLAVNVLRVGWEVMRESVSGLMDEAPEPETMAEIRSIIAANGKGAIEAHDIRTRIVGAVTFLEFHLVVPGTMSVNTAHDICDRIEAALRASMGSTLVHIHVEPDTHAKREGIVFWKGPAETCPAPDALPDTGANA